MALDNYIPDQNRFELAGPPQWWLRLLKDFDDSLYVLPSRQGYYYRLAQKRPIRLAVKIVNDILKEQADTQMLATYGLIPVSTINPLANWSPLMFEELTARAPWRQGGADKFIRKVEDLDAEREAKRDARIDQNLSDRAKDGWKLYQAKTGARTFVSTQKARAAKADTPAPSGFKITGSGLLVPSL